MRINIENSVRNQKDLDIHPDWWKIHADDLEASLSQKVANWQELIGKMERFGGREREIRALRRYIDIVTA